MPARIEPTVTSIQVADLGTLKGWANEDGTTQFFGVPYGDLSARFRNSTLKQSWPNDEWDGTRLGGYSPQPQRPFYPFPMPARPHLNESEIDEFNMLNLQITLPKGCSATDRLPVLVFIHGGGFVFGTSNYSILDGKPLANQSTEYGMPTIIVTMNYRVGFYGFLASDDIKEDNRAYGGGNGNFGFVDQANALKWINKHIHNFGGDNERVLLTGQSAGGVSVDMHLRSPHNNLFSTAVLQSGTVPICGVYSEAEYDVVYKKLLIACNIDLNLPPLERLKKLRDVPHEVVSQQTYEVFQGLNLPQFGPCRDGVILGPGVDVPWPSTYVGQTIPYEGTVVLGDCQHEGIIYDQAFSGYSQAYVIDKVRLHLPEPLATEFIANYGLDKDCSTRELYLAQEKIITDGVFTAPPYYIAQANPSCYVYHWEHLSQFDNPWGGFAHHSLDYMWLFGGLTAILTPEERKMSRVLGHHWLSFANGKAPYPSYGESGSSMIYGPNSVAHEETKPTFGGRDVAWFERIKGDIDAVDRLCTDLLLRRPELVSFDYGPGSTNLVKVTQGGPLSI